MSWYSDGEKYNERPDPWFCEKCRKTEVSKEICDRCVKRHMEDEDDKQEESLSDSGE